MKKYLINLLAILVVAVLSISLVSCSKDDEKSFSIVGTWRYDWEDGEGYTILTFSENGTGFENKEEYGYKVTTLSFKYTYNENTGILYTTWKDGSETITNKLDVLSNDKFRLWDEEGDDEYAVFNRQ